MLQKHPGLSRTSCATIAALTCFLCSMPADALTADEVMNKMTSSQRAGFIRGSIDMAAFLFTVKKNRKVGDCLVVWLSDDKGLMEEAFRLLKKYPDREASLLLFDSFAGSCSEAGPALEYGTPPTKGGPRTGGQ